MAYLNKNNMMEGEQVIAQARFHYMLYWVPALLVLLAIALPFIKIGEDTLKIRLIFSGVFLLLALIWAVIINNGKPHDPSEAIRIITGAAVTPTAPAILMVIPCLLNSEFHQPTVRPLSRTTVLVPYVAHSSE